MRYGLARKIVNPRSPLRTVGALRTLGTEDRTSRWDALGKTEFPELPETLIQNRQTATQKSLIHQLQPFFYKSLTTFERIGKTADGTSRLSHYQTLN